MAIIETKNLTYTYSSGTPYEKVAVDDVSISIEKGEIVGIIGHTGSGKSTLIQHFNGLLKPTSGTVLFDGKDIYEDKKFLHDIKFKVGLVFQYPEYQLFEDTVEKDIAYGPSNMKLDENEIKQRVNEAAELVGLKKEFLKKSPFELSGGQKRRAAIAGIIAMRPEVLILDEPAAGLDPRGRDEIFQMIMNYHNETGTTVLLVSHSMEDAAKYSDKILVMNNAKVFDFDTPQKIFRRAAELESIGLTVPQITRVNLMLKEKGISLGDDIFTVDAAVNAITNYLKNREVH